MTVRDPLLDYGGDPAELLSRRLENRVLGRTVRYVYDVFRLLQGRAYQHRLPRQWQPEAELILVEFMQNSKANTFLRLGGGMAISEKLHSGDVVIASGVVRDEGMTKAYVTPNYPAVCSYELVTSFVKAAWKTSSTATASASAARRTVSISRPAIRPWAAISRTSI